jgi:hypothetical protein
MSANAPPAKRRASKAADARGRRDAEQIGALLDLIDRVRDFLKEEGYQRAANDVREAMRQISGETAAAPPLGIPRGFFSARCLYITRCLPG